MGHQARRALAAWLRARGEGAGQDPLWLAYHRDGSRTRLHYGELRDMLQRRTVRAHVKPPSLHSFRRAFALAMLRHGADVISLSGLMGHGSLPVLQRYLKQLSADLRHVHAAHSPADALLHQLSR